MSRGGTPTDNPIIEALNGWMKEELYVDFDLAHCDDVPKLLDEYVRYFNEQRLAAALDYKSPIQYRTESGFWSIPFSIVYFYLTSALVIPFDYVNAEWLPKAVQNTADIRKKQTNRSLSKYREIWIYVGVDIGSWKMWVNSQQK